MASQEENTSPPRSGSARQDYLQWADYFMAVASLSSQRSKDPNTQVGACIVNQEKRIVGTGYNGMPNDCDDDVMPWDLNAQDELEDKHLYVCHAVMNAIVNKNSADVKGCTIYTTLFPCNECAKLIIQSGIKDIVYLSDEYHCRDGTRASRRLLDMAGVSYNKFHPQQRRINIDFDSISRPVQRETNES